MTKETKLAGLLITGAVAYAAYRYFKLPEEEREELVSNIKSKANKVLNKTSEILDTVQDYMSELKEKEEDEVLDKVVVVKNMLFDIFGGKQEKSIN